MAGVRILRKTICASCVLSIPVWGAGTPKTAPLGIVLVANRAHVGDTNAEVGTTIYGGDRVNTDLQGSIQVRTGAVRLFLAEASSVVFEDDQEQSSARLLRGKATFSTGNARAFVLYASSAAIRPETNGPTIGQVAFVTPTELIVTARKGGLAVTVEDETKIVEEGQSYLVECAPPRCPEAGPPQCPGSGPPARGGGPLKAGRSRFLIVSTAFIAGATTFAILEAYESPSRP
jgi:hypothetical protein